MLRLQLVQLGSKISAHLPRALHQIHTPHLIDRSNRRRESQWMRLIGVSMREKMIFKVGCDFCAGGAEAEWDCRIGNSFRRSQDIRDYIPVVHGEPFAGTAPSGH